MEEVGEVDVDVKDAVSAVASDARDWGAMERTGSFFASMSAPLLASRKVKTSVCDWRVISTDSAEVMQPLK